MVGLCLAESVDGRGELRPEEVDAVLRCPARTLAERLIVSVCEFDKPLTLNKPPSAEPLAPCRPVACVDTDDIDDASESLPPVIELIKFDAVELVLFFLGRGGSTLPGNSVRSLLCRRLKSPYRRPMKYSISPFRFTRRINSLSRVSTSAEVAHREMAYSVLVVPDVALNRRDPDASDIDIPAIQIVSLWLGGYEPSIDSVAVDDLEFREPDALFKAGRCWNARHHHQLNELLRLDG